MLKPYILCYKSFIQNIFQQGFSLVFLQQKQNLYQMFSILSQQADEKYALDNESSQQNQQRYRRGKKNKIQKENKLFSKNRKQYYWNDFEHKRYINFVKASIQILQLTVQERKLIKINVLMSQRVKTRNPAQCHTHHQKMLKKYRNVQGILQNHFYLFNQDESMELKNILKANFGQKKSVDQILSYSQNLSLASHQIINPLDQSKDLSITPKLQMHSSFLGMKLRPLGISEDNFDAHERELQWIDWQ